MVGSLGDWRAAKKSRLDWGRRGLRCTILALMPHGLGETISHGLGEFAMDMQ